MKKEILIAWQVRLFRNIQRRCTECVLSPPSAPAAPSVEGGNTPRTHGQCRILYPEDHPRRPPSARPRPPRLVRQNEPDSADLYKRVEKKTNIFALYDLYSVHKISRYTIIIGRFVFHFLLQLLILWEHVSLLSDVFVK